MITDIIDTTFTVEHDCFGVLLKKELKPGGSSVAVTEDNKKEYVRLYVNFRFMQVWRLSFHLLSLLAVYFYFCH